MLWLLSLLIILNLASQEEYSATGIASDALNTKVSSTRGELDSKRVSHSRVKLYESKESNVDAEAIIAELTEVCELNTNSYRKSVRAIRPMEKFLDTLTVEEVSAVLKHSNKRKYLDSGFTLLAAKFYAKHKDAISGTPSNQLVKIIAEDSVQME